MLLVAIVYCYENEKRTLTLDESQTLCGQYRRGPRPDTFPPGFQALSIILLDSFGGEKDLTSK